MKAITGSLGIVLLKTILVYTGKCRAAGAVFSVCVPHAENIFHFLDSKEKTMRGKIWVLALAATCAMGLSGLAQAKEKGKLNASCCAVQGEALRMLENKDIALEMANVNPWAAQSFMFIYSLSSGENGEILENSEFMGMQPLDPASFNTENAKKLIHLYHDKKEPSQEDAARLIQAGNAKIRTVHEVTKTADGGAWLAMRISAVDAQDYTEISRILPDVRVKLRRVEDDRGGHWEPIGLEY